MILPIPRRRIWICFLLLASFGDHGIGVRAETSLAPGGVKVSRYPNMDAPGNDATRVRGVASVEQCESLCLAAPGCAGYTYNVKHSTCIPKTFIGPLVPTLEAAITGVVDRRGGGQAAQRRQIGVEGKPSFDCRKAHGETEQTVCASAELSRFDVQLANLYWMRIAKLKGPKAEEEKRRQHDWGVVRNNAERTPPASNSPISAGSLSLAHRFKLRRLRLRKLNRNKFTRLRFSRRQSRMPSRGPKRGRRGRSARFNSCPIPSA